MKQINQRQVASTGRAYAKSQSRINTDCQHTDVVIIGAGHAGLSASRVLKSYGIVHVILEKGEIANTWKNEYWDSLKLLTPNWMCRLPDYSYSGDDPDGFMSKQEVAGFFSQYAERINAPVHTHTNVIRVTQTPTGFQVTTSNGNWSCNGLILASGVNSKSIVPALSRDIPIHIKQLTAKTYRNQFSNI